MSITATSLPDALCQVLRANAPATAAFGDTYNPTMTVAQNQAAGLICKFWSDYAAQISEPSSSSRKWAKSTRL